MVEGDLQMLWRIEAGAVTVEKPIENWSRAFSSGISIEGCARCFGMKRRTISDAFPSSGAQRMSFYWDTVCGKRDRQFQDL